MYDFKLLKPLSGFLYVLGWCIGVISIIFGASVAFQYNNDLGVIPGIGILLIGVALGAFLLVISNLILLLLQIEKNTRKQS